MREKNILFFLAALLLQLTCFSQNKNVLFEGVPVFHGAQIVGNYPNTPFIFTVPATGERPITFSIKNLPQGLVLDAATGIITGNVITTGEYKLKIEI